jgi:DNA-binding MarR family transcriptional regulator
MHAVLFSLKRVHQRFLARTRKWTAPFDLTPARYDMLAALHRHRWTERVPQSWLLRTLGVTAPTVSRMVTSLQERGLVVRIVNKSDRRRRYVLLTAYGRRMLRCARRFAVHSFKVARALYRTLGTHPRSRNADSRLMELEDALYGMRKRLKDTAACIYPWHAD